VASTGQWTGPTSIPAVKNQPPPISFTGPGLSATGDRYPQVAINPAGDEVATWLHIENGNATVQVSVRAAGSGWLAPQRLSPAGIPAGEPTLALDPAGHALVAWSVDATIQATSATVPAAPWQPAVDVTPEEAGAGEPRAAVDRAGDGVLVWSAYGYNAPGSIRAITFNAARPAPGYRPPVPVIANASLARMRFRARKPHDKKRGDAGTRIRFNLSTQAWVTTTIKRLPHEERGGCASSKRSGLRRCGRAVVVGTFQSREPAGLDRIAFAGILVHRLVFIGRRGPVTTIVLKPGNYAAVLTASNINGTSKAVTLLFIIVP
jgi:hypothetical protein